MSGWFRPGTLLNKREGEMRIAQHGKRGLIRFLQRVRSDEMDEQMMSAVMASSA